jgi:hypothetical protein
MNQQPYITLESYLENAAGGWDDMFSSGQIRNVEALSDPMPRVTRARETTDCHYEINRSERPNSAAEAPHRIVGLAYAYRRGPITVLMQF